MLTPRKPKSSWSTPQEVPVSSRRAGSSPPHAAIPAGGGASPGRQMKTRPTYQLVLRRPPRSTNTQPGANTDVVRPKGGPRAHQTEYLSWGPGDNNQTQGTGRHNTHPKVSTRGPANGPETSVRGFHLTKGMRQRCDEPARDGARPPIMTDSDVREITTGARD